MLANICPLETSILESSSVTSPTSEGPFSGQETRWKCLRGSRGSFRRPSQSRRSVSSLHSQNIHPPSDLTHSVSPFPSICSTSKRATYATLLVHVSCSLHSHVVPVLWLAPGLISSCGKHSQELLSVHGARYNDLSLNRRTS